MVLNRSRTFLILHLKTGLPGSNLLPFPLLRKNFQPETKSILFSRFRTRTTIEMNVSTSSKTSRSEKKQPPPPPTQSLNVLHELEDSPKLLPLLRFVSSFHLLYVSSYFSLWTYYRIDSSTKCRSSSKAYSCAHAQHRCVEILLRVR